MHVFPKLVDLARSPEELQEEAAEHGLPAPKAPVYPYGCCISFDEETMEKLGLDGDAPSIGDEIHFSGEARVTNVSARPDGTCTRVELQITKMSCAAEDETEAEEEEEEARRDRFYGKADSGSVLAKEEAVPGSD